ncbi:MAG: VOC family protein [Pseudomonadota bacterium]
MAQMILDHLVVGATTLAAAQDHVEQSLGLAMQAGGQHAVFHTHNALIGLEDGLYLEAIAPDPSRPAPERPRWYDLDRYSGPARLSNWAAAVPDMDAALPMMPDGVGSPVQVRRGDLQWRMAVSAMGTTPYDNLWPALIEWPGGMHPAPRLAPSGLRLRRLTLSHPQGDRLAETLAALIQDDRIRVEVGEIGLEAAFDGPRGACSLT